MVHKQLKFEIFRH